MLELGAEHSDVYCLGTGCLKLGLGLLDLNLGANSSLKSALVQLQGLLIQRDGRVQKLLLIWPRTMICDPRGSSFWLVLMIEKMSFETPPRSRPWTEPNMSITGATL